MPGEHASAKDPSRAGMQFTITPRRCHKVTDIQLLSSRDALLTYIRLSGQSSRRMQMLIVGICRYPYASICQLRPVKLPSTPLVRSRETSTAMSTKGSGCSYFDGNGAIKDASQFGPAGAVSRAGRRGRAHALDGRLRAHQIYPARLSSTSGDSSSTMKCTGIDHCADKANVGGSEGCTGAQHQRPEFLRLFACCRPVLTVSKKLVGH